MSDKKIKVINSSNKVRGQKCNADQHLTTECEKVTVNQNTDNNKPVQCQICRKFYHSAAECRSRLKCSHCGKSGHEVNNFYFNPANQKPAFQTNSYTNPPSRTNGDTKVECYFCHKRGHRIAVCRKRLRLERSSQENQGNVNSHQEQPVSNKNIKKQNINPKKTK